MKKIAAAIFGSLLAFISQAQTHVDVKPDSVKVVNGELVIQNATKNIQGYLYNLGNGITQFQPISAVQFDNLPTTGSNNAVYSFGIKNYVDSTKWLLDNLHNFNTSGKPLTGVGNQGNIVLGWIAGSGSALTGQHNIVIGKQAGEQLGYAWNNVFLGYKAGRSVISGLANIYIGRNVGNESNDGSYNIGLGWGLAFNGSRKLNIGGVLFGNNMNSDGSSTFYGPVTEGQIGIGIANPTAVLQLAAGQSIANLAPLKFTAGTNLATPEDGAVEYDGTNYYVTAGTTRYKLAKTLTDTHALTFSNIPASGHLDQSFTIAGAQPGDVVSLGIPVDAISDTVIFSAWVSSVDTVTVRATNLGSATSASGTFKATITR